MKDIALVCLVAFFIWSWMHPLDNRDRCVVCHPSGKLAMWGECE